MGLDIALGITLDVALGSTIHKEDSSSEEEEYVQHPTHTHGRVNFCRFLTNNNKEIISKIDLATVVMKILIDK